jgi:hypothetical protein
MQSVKLLPAEYGLQQDSTPPHPLPTTHCLHNVYFLYCRGVHRIKIYIRYTCLANFGASETLTLCSKYVEKSAKYSEQKCAGYFGKYISRNLNVV